MLTDDLRQIVKEHFPDELDSFDIAGEDFVADLERGKQPSKRSGAADFRFNVDGDTVLAFVKLLTATIPLILEIRKAFAKTGMEERKNRWRSALLAAGLAPATVDRIVADHGEKLLS